MVLQRIFATWLLYSKLEVVFYLKFIFTALSYIPSEVLKSLC